MAEGADVDVLVGAAGVLLAQLLRTMTRHSPTTRMSSPTSTTLPKHHRRVARAPTQLILTILLLPTRTATRSELTTKINNNKNKNNKNNHKNNSKNNDSLVSLEKTGVDAVVRADADEEVVASTTTLA